jgi:hypothetical protein
MNRAAIHLNSVRLKLLILTDYLQQLPTLCLHIPGAPAELPDGCLADGRSVELLTDAPGGSNRAHLPTMSITEARTHAWR